MSDLKIASARIANLPCKLGDPLPIVYVTTTDGVEQRLFDYYPDELVFTPEEFVGLTIDEGRELKRKKDVAYLQSP